MPPHDFESFLVVPAGEYLKPVIDDLARHAASTEPEVAPTLPVLPQQYSLGDELDRGGMATVFTGFDKTLNRPVAIKVMRAGLLDAASAKRFENEIAVMARLEHPRIVPIYFSGQDNGVLFYVMRKYDAGSLRNRLEREGRLPIVDAIALAHNVAEALDHAHARGILHRDIKPENILVGPEGAAVGDFGVARFMDAAGAERLTRVGVAIGTPEYMSPEQSDPGGHIDGRTDVYALGCVLYEMLAGEPPYKGSSHHDVIAKHRGAAIPDVRVLRATVTVGMHRVLQRALAKSAADRFRTAGEFVKAFNRAYENRTLDERQPIVTRRRVVAAAMVAALSIGAYSLPSNMRRFVDTVPVQSSRYLVLPFADGGRVAGRLQLRERMLDEFGRWRGVSLADEFRFSAAFRPGASPRSLARTLGAGRYVKGEVTAIGDSLRVHAAVYDTRGDTVEQEVSLRVAATASDSTAARLVEALLFGDHPLEARRQCRTSRVHDAYRACLIAQQDIADWQLASADAALTQAVAGYAGYTGAADAVAYDTVAHDPDYLHAHLWLAQVRMWLGEPASRWVSDAERVNAARHQLDDVEALQSAALLAYARRDFATACRSWQRLARLTDRGSAWYSLARCLRADGAVVPDSRSVSGWRFRTSDHQAMLAFRRAFLLQPSILRAFQSDLFAGVREMFVTSRTVVRRGRSVGVNPVSFIGRASWTSGDTLVFVPFRESDVRASVPATQLVSTDEAVTHQRRVFAEVATSWLAASPTSAPAMEAVSTSLEMLGDAAARDSLRRARQLAATGAERIRIGAHEVLVLLKFGAPSDTASLHRARALADSLLREQGPDAECNGHLLAALAALTGRAALAADLTRAPFNGQGQQRSAVTATGVRLLAFSSLGGPGDSLRAHEQRLENAIETTLPAAERAGARAEWLARSITLAFPDVALSDPVVARGGDDPLLDAQLALLRGRAGSTRKYLANVQRARARARVPAYDLSYDGTVPEAVMLARMGDTTDAFGRLDQLLRVLPETAPLALGDVAAAGAYMRAVALAAELAHAQGDHERARGLARLVTIFWSDCDAFLRPTVIRMKAIAG